MGVLPGLPWRRAPRAGLANPTSLLTAFAVATAGTFVAAAALLFTASTGPAALDYQVQRYCPATATPVLDAEAASPATAGAVLGSTEFLGDTYGFRAVRASYVTQGEVGFDRSAAELRVAYRDGATEHLRVLRGGGPGLWIPESTARETGVRLGERPVLYLGSAVTLPPVTAVYADLVHPLDDWWCSEQRILRPSPLAESGDAPPAFVTDEEDFVAVRDQLPETTVIDVTAVFETAPPADITAATDLAGRSGDLAGALGSELRVGRPLTGSAGEQLGRMVELAIDSRRAVGLAILPLAAVSVLVGVAAMAAVGVQWAQRRAAEVRLLWLRGVSPAGLGVKALLELAAPLLLGVVAGPVLATITVPLFAPSAAGESGTSLLVVLVTVAVTVALAATLVGAVVLTVRRTLERRVGPVWWRRALRLVPWELGSAALAVLSYQRLADGALTLVYGDPVPRVDPLAIGFPLFVVLTVAGLVARVAGAGLRATHRVRAWRLLPVQLAVRRLAAGRGTVAAVVAVAALAVSTLAISAGISSSQTDALERKSELLLGAPTVMLLDSDAEEAPPRTAPGETLVGAAVADVGRGELDVLVIDPETFASAASWRTDYADAELGELLAALADPLPDGALPALRVGDAPDRDAVLDGDAGDATVRPVAATTLIPGLGQARSGYVIADPGGEPVAGSLSLWSRDDQRTVLSRLTAQGVAALTVQTTADAVDALPFLTVTWTFGFFGVIGGVLGALTLLALLLIVDARRRRQALTLALARRMGLRRRPMVVSYLVEVAAVLGGALIAGLAAGLGAAWASASGLDPAPRLLPVPALPPQWTLVLVVLGAGAVGAVLVCAATVRGVTAARVRELLRE